MRQRIPGRARGGATATRSGRFVPARAAVAVAALVLASGLIGALLGAYLHELRGHRVGESASYEQPSRPAPRTVTKVTTTVVPGAPAQQAGTRVVTVPAAPRTSTMTVVERHTVTKRPVTVTRSPRPTGGPSRTAVPTTPAPTGESCGGLLGCLLEEPRGGG